jgi:molybdopterin converting factor small subunit
VLLKIEYYGYIREQVKHSTEEHSTNCITIDALLQEIQDNHHIDFPTTRTSPGARNSPFIVAINANLIQPAQFTEPELFKDGDTIAIMPPFAGG